jgi:NTP pyrophosphatase (non-canonical NTP hydrolase)
MTEMVHERRSPWPLDTEVLFAHMKDLQDVAAAIVRAYEVQQGFQRDLDAYQLKVAEELGELVQAYLQHTGRRQSDGSSPERIWDNVENQATDVLMYLLIFCRHAGIDLPQALTRKWFVFGDEVDEGLRSL